MRASRHPAAFLAPALLLALVLAGCSDAPEPPRGPPAAERDPEWAVRALFAGADPADTDRMPDHDHGNRSVHQGLTSANIEIVGYTELASPYFGGPAGSHACADVSAAGGTRQIAVVHSHNTDVAFSAIDVTNPAAPVFLGELVLPFAFVYDVAIFPDGRYVALAVNPDLRLDRQPGGPAAQPTGLAGVAVGPVPIQPLWRDACGNEEPAGSEVDYTPYGYATLLVDLQDPAAPRVVDAYPYANGRNVHSISVAEIDGIRYVATSGLQAVPCTVPGISGNPVPNPVPCQPVPRYGTFLSHYDFLTVEDLPSGPKLVPHSYYSPPGNMTLEPALLELHSGHTDATLQKHPVTNETIAYLANWDGGFLTLRLEGRGQVTPLDRWGEASPAAGGDPTQMTGNVHTAKPADGLRNGRHLTITGQELAGRPAGRPTGQIVLLDTTDPANVVPVARWTLPVDIDWPAAWGLRFSTHYAILSGDLLVVAAYHSGAWVVDAREASWPELPSLGVLIPDRAPSAPPASASDTPEVMEVLDLGDGTLAAFDGDTGIYTFRYVPDHLDVPPALPWTEDAWIGT